MEIPVSFMVERLKRLPNKAFIIEDGSKVYAVVKDELVIFTGKPGEFNKMTEHELATFIRKNANKQGTPVEPTVPPSVEFPAYQEGDWFEDVQEGQTNLWEFQYNIDKDKLMWVNIHNHSRLAPNGRHVERPVFPGDAVQMFLDSDWFVDTRTDAHQAWQYQYDISTNRYEWTAIIYPFVGTPIGRQIPRPIDAFWNPDFKEETDADTP